MNPGNALTTRWNDWAARFAALLPREKHMIIGATGFALLFGGYSLWIEPGQLQVARAKKSLAQQSTELGQLRTQVATLKAQNTDPNLAGRTALNQAREQLAVTEQNLQRFDSTLVAPSQAPALLQRLLTRHRGLTLVSLVTLPPQPLIEATPGKTGKTDKVSRSEESAAMPGGNIYKHGIEIKLSGRYHDLLAYVAELESSPQKLLWGGLRLGVTGHPLSELTLTVYTLSLDSTWLVV